MIKSHRKYQRHYKKQHEYTAVIRADDQQKEETDKENYELGSNDVGENRADKKPSSRLKSARQ
jgi:hypothetical protein